MNRAITVVISLVIILAGTGSVLLMRHELSSNLAHPVVVPKSAHDPVALRLRQMSLRDRVASLFMFHAPGIDPVALERFTALYKPGGMIVMGDNVPTDSTAIATVSTALRGDDSAFPRLVAVDQEGGVVSRLDGDSFSSALELRSQPIAEVSASFSARSSLVQSAGITVNFGIVADVTDDPTSFIYSRVLGTNQQSASVRVAAAVNSSVDKTLSTIKHFPGHGETAADSHVSVPTTSVSLLDWQQRDQPSFQAGIDAGADIVMMGHLRFSAIDPQPASVSKEWHRLLRNQMGFNGIIISDDMVMLQDSSEPAYSDPVANAIAALQAGSTMLLYVLDNNGSPSSMINPGVLIDGVVAAVDDGRLTRQQVTQAARQLLVARHRSAALLP